MPGAPMKSPAQARREGEEAELPSAVSEDFAPPGNMLALIQKRNQRRHSGRHDSLPHMIVEEDEGVEERVLSQLLNEIDGIQDSRGIFVLGCTNQPLTELDDAILRPGRFEVHLHLEHPSERDRQEIAALWCGRVFRSGSAGSGPPGAASEVAGARAELERWVAAETEGASGAEIGWLFQQAAIELASGGHGGDGRIHDAAFEEALRSATARLKPRLAARVSSRDA